ncbi:MAG: GFA family protein [Candidatus Binatia bacterium]
MEPTEALEGGCLCGSVRYRAWGKTYGITHCHCQTCRRASGAPFVTWAGFDADKFTFTRGQPAAYASSSKVLRTFCNTCGTGLTYQRLDLPDSIDVTLGSMDAPESLKPEDHTWTESQLSWIVLGDLLPIYRRERNVHER